MACGQCSSGSCGSINILSSDKNTVPGCSSGGCSSSGCNKMNSFDWLSNMNIGAAKKYNVVEVKFKGGRKEYFINKNHVELYTGDFVVCEMASGFHIGSVSLQGDLVRLQLLKRGISDTAELKTIHRLANEKDLEKHSQAINRDLPTMYRTREICKELKLNLKLSEVEFQSDNTKATFYYSADDRVDFRELIKMLAAEFKVRVEMRQISLRQEAGRLGGIGSCGRELCCSTWLTDFKAIPTAAARYQNLSLNPAKLSGQCGRLKCCLNYELETYIDAIKGIPTVEKPLKTEKGNATLQKTDIFRRIMWFSYPEETNWYPVPCDQVTEIIKMNAEGKKPVALENLLEIADVPVAKPISINNDLERLDKKYDKKRSKKRKPAQTSNKSESTIMATSDSKAPIGNRNITPKGNSESDNSKPQARNNHHQKRANDGNQTPKHPSKEAGEGAQKQQPQRNNNIKSIAQPDQGNQQQAKNNNTPKNLTETEPSSTTPNGEKKNKKRRKYKNNKPSQGTEGQKPQ